MRSLALLTLGQLFVSPLLLFIMFQSEKESVADHHENTGRQGLVGEWTESGLL